MQKLIRKTLLLTALSLSTLKASCETLDSTADSHQTAHNFISSSQRPEDLKLAIRNNRGAHETYWTVNGQYPSKDNQSSMYNFFGAHAHEILVQYIATHPEQTEFNILDFGAGQGGLLKMLAEGVIGILPPEHAHVTVNIFGITGGDYLKKIDNPSGQVGNCTIRYIDKSMIENIAEIDDLKGIPFDIIFSQSTFQHLTDPMGTLVDVFSMLKEGGYFFGDVPETVVCHSVKHTTPDIAHFIYNDRGHYLAKYCNHLGLQRVDANKGLSIPAQYTSPYTPAVAYEMLDVPAQYELENEAQNSDQILGFLFSIFDKFGTIGGYKSSKEMINQYKETTAKKRYKLLKAKR